MYVLPEMPEELKKIGAYCSKEELKNDKEWSCDCNACEEKK